MSLITFLGAVYPPSLIESMSNVKSNKIKPKPKTNTKQANRKEKQLRIKKS